MNANNESCPFCGSTQRVHVCYGMQDAHDKANNFAKLAATTAPGASESRGSVPDDWRVVARNLADEWQRLSCDLRTGTQAMAYGQCSSSLRALIAAAPTPPAVSNGELPDWAIAQVFRERFKSVDMRVEAAYELQRINDKARELARSAAAKGEG